MTASINAGLKLIALKLNMKRSPVFAVAYLVREKLNLEKIALELDCTPVQIEAIHKAVVGLFADEAAGKKEKKEASARKGGKPAPIAADWKPDETCVKYARDLDLTPEHIHDIAARFAAYWRDRGIERVSWSQTWMTWVRREADKKPKQEEARPGGMSLDTWRQAYRTYREDSFWPSAFGPEPGQAGCRVPAEIMAGG